VSHQSRETGRAAELFFEAADIARSLELVPATIRYHIQQGHITPAATTLRGTRLFREADVEALRQHLAKRRRAR
jgi:DNA-binding transcriptional MerR regulator